MDDMAIKSSIPDSDNSYVNITKHNHSEDDQSEPVVVNNVGEMTDEEEDDDLKLQARSRGKLFDLPCEGTHSHI